MNEITKVFISPHTDDECLFGAFTIMRERPLVIIVYDSYIQVARGDAACDHGSRMVETMNALHEMDPELAPIFVGLHDDTKHTVHEVAQAILSALPVSSWETIKDVWAPAYEEGGHEQHNLVAQAVNGLCNHRYLTYTRAGGKTRVARLGDYIKAVPRTPDMIRRKHLAMSCYTSQIANPSTQPWFTMDIEEYYA